MGGACIIIMTLFISDRAVQVFSPQHQRLPRAQLELKNLFLFYTHTMESSSTACPKRRASLRAPGMLLSVLLMLVMLPSPAASQCPSSQCIRPQPLPASFALGEAELSTTLMALRCEMVCIKEVRLHSLRATILFISDIVM